MICSFALTGQSVFSTHADNVYPAVCLANNAPPWLKIERILLVNVPLWCGGGPTVKSRIAWSFPPAPYKLMTKGQFTGSDI